MLADAHFWMNYNLSSNRLTQNYNATVTEQFQIPSSGEYAVDNETTTTFCHTSAFMSHLLHKGRQQTFLLMNDWRDLHRLSRHSSQSLAPEPPDGLSSPARFDSLCPSPLSPDSVRRRCCCAHLSCGHLGQILKQRRGCSDRLSGS